VIPWPIGALKMDVETFEYAVFQGGQRFFDIARIPFIVFESMYLKPQDRMAMIAWFKARGYVPSTVGFFKGLEPDMVDTPEEMIYLSLKGV
jgi:hypothetical protein